MTLVDFLLARLDEDEAMANAAASDRGPYWFRVDDGVYPEHRAIEASPTPDPDDGGGGMVADSEGYIGLAEGAHIARHDPARVLADIEAKRRIIAEHQITVKRLMTYPFNPMTGEPQPVEYGVDCSLCGWVGFDPTSACLTVRLLALPFAAHSDYQEDWTP